MKMQNLPRVALVGVSGYARVYLEWLEGAAHRGEIDFAAAVVVDSLAEQEVCIRLKRLGVEVFDSWQVMLCAWQGRLDLCCLPVPIQLHAEITVAALEAGANVLVEKPLAADLHQVSEILETEKRTGRWVAVGYQDFYLDSTRLIAEELVAGKIGRVRTLRLLGVSPRPLSYYQRNSWAGRLKIDGMPVWDSPLNNAMAHFVNLSLYWAGVQSKCFAFPYEVEAELFRCYPIESFDTAAVRVRLLDGTRVHMAVTHCCEVGQPVSIRIQGDEGELEWIFRERAVWVGRDGSIEEMNLEERSSAIDGMFAAVLARLNSSDVRICTATQARLQVACIEALPKKVCSISAGHLQDQRLQEGPAVYIKNGVAELARCLRNGFLPSEAGVAWARNGHLDAAKTI